MLWWLAGCSPKVAPVDLPFDTLQAFSLPGETATPERWWVAFEDPQLNALIDTALQNNLPLHSAWYQVEEAGAIVDIASSLKWPQLFLELRSGISRPEPDFVGGEVTELSIGASYEADLWGRIRYSVHAEEFRFKASYYDYKTAAVSLSAEIAINWFRLITLRQQQQLIEEQLETNNKVLALIRARFAGGQVRGVDILRQQQLIAATQEQLIALEAQTEVLKNQLSVLLGRPPGGPIPLGVQFPELPPLPQTGVPLQLVNRRPDVLSAFYRLQASDREVAVAISNKYPRLNFSLEAAIRSNTWSDLVQSQAASLAGNLLAPLFFGGRLSAEVNRAEAFRQQLLNEYGQTVLVAFQEVENALIRETNLLEQLVIVEEQLDLAEKTFDQLRLEYLNGSIPYLDVLITLGQQQQLRRDLLSTRLAVLEARISLYRALAGGFNTQRELLAE